MTRPTSERGSSLLLFPAAVLVMMVLGAIAVDFSIAFLGERELAGATAAAANDTAARALSNRAFYREGVVVLDGAAASELATDEVRAALDPSATTTCASPSRGARRPPRDRHRLRRGRLPLRPCPARRRRTGARRRHLERLAPVCMKLLEILNGYLL